MTHDAAAPPDLSQPCCAVEGLTQLLSFVPGDFAVVLHSEPDCANLVYRDARAVDPRRFFCSNLSEADAIAGRGRVRLAGAVREAIVRRRPATVFVVGGCVASLLADDVDALAGSIELPRGVRVVALAGGAFAMYGQAATVDNFTGILVEAAPRRGRKTRRAVNLVGFPPDDGEAAKILGRAGIAIHARPQLDSAQSIWNRLPGAEQTVVSDAGLFARVAGILRQRHRVPTVELPLPYGAGPTAQLYEGIAERLGRGAALHATLGTARAAAQAVAAAFRRRHRGRRLAYHVGGRKDFELHTLVRGGLAFVPLFLELGFDVELMFQGAVEEERRRRIEVLLAHHGITLPYRCLPDRLSLTGALCEGRFDVVHCSDSLREEAGAAGVPILPIGGLRPGFAGVRSNCTRLDELLR